MGTKLAPTKAARSPSMSCGGACVCACVPSLGTNALGEPAGMENACAMVAAAAAAAAMVSMQAKEKAGESAKPNDEKLDKIAERILHNLQLCVTNVHIR